MSTLNPLDQQDILKRVYDTAFEYERVQGCCPQCVLAAVQDVVGVGGDELFKAAHTLTAGGAMTTTGTCGALAGALMAVGCVHGRSRADFANGPGIPSFVLAKRVFDAFVEEFGSPICADIQTKLMGRPFDMWDGAEFKAFLAAGGHEDKCPHVVATAAQIATGLLLSEAEAE